jgi:Protein of unknown function (DUF3592)
VGFSASVFAIVMPCPDATMEPSLLSQSAGVWDLLYEAPLLWWVPIIGALPLVLYGILVRRTRHFLFALVWLVVSILIFLSSVVFLGGNLWDRHKLRSGEISVVEGEVMDFHPTTVVSSRPETFRIGGVRFSYNDFTVTGGYSTTESRGGLIRPGQVLRVYYDSSDQGNRILRIEAQADQVK